MNRIFSRCMALVAMMLLTSMSVTAQVLEDFYNYEENSVWDSELDDNVEVYEVKLTDEFMEELNKGSGGVFKSGSYTWKTGDPLPNPALNGLYKGKKVVSMNQMFYDCSNIITLDLSEFNTSNVFDMERMFIGCTSLTSVNLSSFNTEKLVYASKMFENCVSLQSLDLSSFKTDKVKTMSGMFDGCSSLTKLNLKSFNTKNVTDMTSMFSNCSSLSTLDLSNFNTTRVKYMESMFYECSSLSSLDLSSFNTSMVNDMDYMFKGCSSLTSLDLSSFDFANVADMYNILDDCGVEGNFLVYVKDDAALELIKKAYPSGEVKIKGKVETKTVTVTSAGGATLTAPANLDFSGAEKIKAYYVVGDYAAGKVTLTETKTVAEGEAVLLLAEGGATEEIPVAAEATAAERSVNMLYPVTETIEHQTQHQSIGSVHIFYYILNNGDEGLGFYLANNKRVDAGKAYLVVRSISAESAKVLTWDFNEATAIEPVVAAEHAADAPIYNLQGQRLSKPAKGINIIGGKKVIMR